MPKANATCIYQFKICSLVHKLAGDIIDNYDADEENCLLLLFDKSETLPKLISLKDSHDCFDEIDKLIEAGESFIFLDNFDPNMYAFLRWNKISRDKMEALMGDIFNERDFINMKTKQTRVYQESSSCMLG